MTVRVRRVFEFTVSPSDVWEFIADPSKRADAISVVDTYEVDNSLNTNDDNVPTSATWEVALPIPLIDSTATVDTEDVERDPPTHVKFAAFAEMAKNGGQYPAANAAVALVLHRFFPRVECSLSVRESPATPTGAMADGYYDLAYVAAGEEETCIPIPKLRPSIAYWFAAHAERRAPQPHNRDTSGDGPTLADLTALLGEDPVEEAMAAVLADA